MNEKELKELMKTMEAQGWQPQLCDTQVPVYEGIVPCGIPTMCGDYQTDSTPLPMGLLSMHPEFMVPVRGDSMKDAKIETGDMVNVVCDVPVYDGDVVLACIDGEYTLKAYFECNEGECWLLPQNEKYEPILLNEEINVRIVGRVKGIVKPAPRISARACEKIVRRAKQAKDKLRTPSELEVSQAIHNVAPMVTVGRQWYAVYRVMADLCVVGEDDFDGFIERVTAAVPEHKNLPTRAEMQRLAVQSFAKPVAQWQAENAPVQGKRYKDYLMIAQRMKEMLKL